MKHVIIIVLTLCATSLLSNAQVDSLRTEKQNTIVLSAKDSLYLNYAASLSKMAANNLPRYKLYKTENLYNLIKLDTATGRVWQVQYGMNGTSKRQEIAIDDSSLLWSWDEVRAGRYELYATDNMYTFILLDTEKGYTYQVQWNFDENKRFRIRIF